MGQRRRLLLCLQPAEGGPHAGRGRHETAEATPPTTTICLLRPQPVPARPCRVAEVHRPDELALAGFLLCPSWELRSGGFNVTLPAGNSTAAWLSICTITVSFMAFTPTTIPSPSGSCHLFAHARQLAFHGPVVLGLVPQTAEQTAARTGDLRRLKRKALLLGRLDR